MTVRFAVSLLRFDVLLTVWMMHAGIVYCKPSLTNSSHGSVSVVLVVGIREFTYPCIILCSHNAVQCHYTNKDVSLGHRVEREARSHLKATSSVISPCTTTLQPFARPSVPTQTLIFNSQGWACMPVLQRKKCPKSFEKSRTWRANVCVCFHCCGLAAWQEVDSVWQAALGPRGVPEGRGLLTPLWRKRRTRAAFLELLLSFRSVISSPSSIRLRGRSRTGPRGALEGPRHCERWKITARATSERIQASSLCLPPYFSFAISHLSYGKTIDLLEGIPLQRQHNPHWAGHGRYFNDLCLKKKKKKANNTQMIWTAERIVF